MHEPVPAALAVGGTDSSGGAGLAADLLTFAAHGVHGLLAVTAVTAQDMSGVRGRTDLPAAAVAAQLEAAAACGPVVAKSGMLATASAACALADALDGALAGVPLVLDPVIRATAGSRLLDVDAVGVLRERLLARALVCTPNLDEASALTGVSDPRSSEILDALLALGPRWVLLTGGHRTGAPDDMLAGADGTRLVLPGVRVPTAYDRGTGCTLASALAARLARGDDVPTAARTAKEFVTAALRGSYPLRGRYGVPRRWRATLTSDVGE
ncbi:MAG TPA: hydroxymethylpyrimidine/phosphomethylpyrimidine kinase [Mycobacteriales bacterium]|nr:hydroxymethylpyrimidine/phosphomethylpyrimidine kinase [Mycobacteriales bacterium]